MAVQAPRHAPTARALGTSKLVETRHRFRRRVRPAPPVALERATTASRGWARSAPTPRASPRSSPRRCRRAPKAWPWSDDQGQAWLSPCGPLPVCSDDARTSVQATGERPRNTCRPCPVSNDRHSIVHVAIGVTRRPHPYVQGASPVAVSSSTSWANHKPQTVPAVEGSSCCSRRFPPTKRETRCTPEARLAGSRREPRTTLLCALMSARQANKVVRSLASRLRLNSLASSGLSHHLSWLSSSRWSFSLHPRVRVTPGADPHGPSGSPRQPTLSELRLSRSHEPHGEDLRPFWPLTSSVITSSNDHINSRYLERWHGASDPLEVFPGRPVIKDSWVRMSGLSP